MACGYTIQQIAEHSLAQLDMVAEAKRKLTAEEALLNLKVVYAAAAGGAAKLKNFVTPLKSLETELRKAAGLD